VIKRSAFIVPSQPVSRKQSPSGPQWIHEAKFDGWRAQLHKAARQSPKQQTPTRAPEGRRVGRES
jgi:ATP-dependent DNA ligase